jgi:hypothetical protein
MYPMEKLDNTIISDVINIILDFKDKETFDIFLNLKLTTPLHKYSFITLKYFKISEIK